MADLTKTIEVVFQGVDHIGTGVDSAMKGLSGLDNKINAVAEPLASVADKVLKVDTALAGMAAGGLAVAIKEAGNFHDSFSEINTLAGTTGQSMEDFKNAILDYAQGSTQSLGDITSSFYQANSMGVKYQDSVSAISTAEKLAVAGRSDLTSTTELLIGTMKSYGASMDQAEKYSDDLFTAVKDGKTTIPELAQSLSQVTGVAAAAGVPFGTLSAALAALTAAGMPTDQAITGVKAAISNIIKPSSQASKEAEQLGIQFNAAALKSKGLNGVLRDVESATGGNVEKMGKLFGSVEGLNAALVLGADKSGAFSKALRDIDNDAGATKTAFDTMKDNINLAINNLVNNIQAVLVGIGSPLLKEFRGDISGISDVLKSIKAGIDEGAFDPLFDALNDAQKKIHEFLEGIADAFPEAIQHVDFSGLIHSLQNLGGTISDLWGNLDFTKPDDLAKAIQFVVDSVKSLVQVTEGIAEGLKPFFDEIVQAIHGFNNLDDATKETAGKILGVAKGVKVAGSAVADAIVAIGANAQELKGAFEVVINSITFLWNSAKISIDTVVMTLIDLFSKLVHLADTVSFGAFSDKLDKAKQTLKDWKEAWQDSFISNAEKVRGDLSGIADGFSDIGGKAKSASDKVITLKDSIAGIPTDLSINTFVTTEGVEDTENQILSIGKSMGLIPDQKTIGITADGKSVEEITKEINAKFPEDKTMTVKATADKVALDKAKTALNMSIPDKKTMEIDAKVQIANIQAQAAEIKQAYQSMAQIQVAQVQSDAQRVQAAFSSVGDTVKSVTDLIGKMTDDFTSTTDQGKAGQIWMWMNDQLKNQDKALQMQQKLTSAQIDYMQARTDAMNRGDSMITVEAPGLKPELEAFMWKILEAIQLRATEEAADFLLGINGSALTAPTAAA